MVWHIYEMQVFGCNVAMIYFRLQACDQTLKVVTARSVGKVVCDVATEPKGPQNMRDHDTLNFALDCT